MTHGPVYFWSVSSLPTSMQAPPCRTSPKGQGSLFFCLRGRPLGDEPLRRRRLQPTAVGWRPTTASCSSCSISVGALVDPPPCMGQVFVFALRGHPAPMCTPSQPVRSVSSRHLLTPPTGHPQPHLGGALQVPHRLPRQAPSDSS